MGWATTLISPPDGALGAFRESLRRLQGRPETVYYPGPRRAGAPIRSASSPTSSRTATRREAEIVAALARGPATVAGARRRRSTPTSTRRLHGAAARNVLAHLVDLEARGLVVADGGRFALAAAS